MPTTRALGALLTVVALASLGCGPEPEPEPPTTTPPREDPRDDVPWPDPGDELVIEVRPGQGPARFVTEPRDVRVEVVRAAGGRVTTGRGPVAESGAAVFPETEATADGALAALKIDLAPERNAFAPGDEEFAIGVDIYFPAAATRSAVDNGDNLLQRGLFGDVGQLKLQADGGQPSCRIAGTQGALEVGSKVPLEPRTWYRLRCQRDDDGVTLYAGEIGDDGTVTSWRTWEESGEVGDITFDDRTPVSVGGKLNPKGGLVPDNPDQFNGWLARVVYFSR